MKSIAKNSRLLSKIPFGLSIACATLLTLSTDAHANGKVYPGSLCWGNPLEGSNLVHTAGGNVMNITDYYADAWCPLITDNTGNQAGLSRVRVSISESWEPDEGYCE